MDNLQVLRIDDIPLLYSQVKELQIQDTIDKVITPHGNRSGLSLGHLVSIWLCYLLSESDHRLSSVESWVRDNLILLQSLSGVSEMTVKDFTDDRLEQALDYLSIPTNWEGINRLLFQNSIEAYDMDADCTVRLDAAPMQGHHQIKENGGLFQHGYSKHHDSGLGMVKIMLACLDNEINGFSFPLCHFTVSGEQADDGLYLPVVKECNQIFTQAKNFSAKLYVGDSKMGSKANRWYIVNSGHHYLCPLSKKQLSQEEIIACITQTPKSEFQQFYKENGDGSKVLDAEGFEKEYKVEYTDESGQLHQWSERRIFVLSTNYSEAQKKSLDAKIARTQQELNNLVISQRGRKLPKTAEELQSCINEILSSANLGGLIDVTIEQQEHRKQIRAYKERPAREEVTYTFQLDIQPLRDKINEKKATLGWQVYATDVEKASLSFQNCVSKYRKQNRVETRFNDLRNKVVPLVPIFVKKDNRTEALINLLMLGLKVCAIMEHKAAKKLLQKQEKLTGIYEGNPKKASAAPTAKRLLKQFSVSLVMIPDSGKKTVDIKMTAMDKTQTTIIELLNFKEDIYSDLTTEIQKFFSLNQISEN